MKYYEQLLESFKKLKKRTFKLTILEQDGGAEAKADAEIKAASTQQATRDNPYTVPGISTSTGHPIVLFVTQKGVNWAPYSNKGIGFQQKTFEDPGRAKFIGFFEGEGQEQTTTPEVPGQATTTDQVPMDPKDAPVGATIEGYAEGMLPWGVRIPKVGGFKNLGKIFRDIAGKFEKLCEDLKGAINKARRQDDVNQGRTEEGDIINDPSTGGQAIKKGSKFRRTASCITFNSVIAGGGRLSHEHQIGKGRKVGGIIKDGEVSLVPLDPIDAEHGLNKVDELLGVLDPKKTDASDAISIKDTLEYFKFMDDGSVVIEYEDGKGIIFRDRTGVLKGMLQAAKEKYNDIKEETDLELEIGKYTKKATSGSLAAVRGKMLESMQAYHTLREICEEGRGALAANRGVEPQGMLTYYKSACLAASEQKENFLKHKNTFLEIHSWGLTYDVGDAAASVADADLLEELKEHGYEGENLNKILLALKVMSDEADARLDADFSLPVGDVAARKNSSDKDDAIVMWEAKCNDEGEDCNCDHAADNIDAGKKYQKGTGANLVEYAPNGINDVDADMPDVIAGQGPAMKDFLNDRFKGKPLCLFRNGIKNSLSKTGVVGGVRKNINDTMLLDLKEDKRITEVAYDFFKSENDSYEDIDTRVKKTWKKLSDIGDSYDSLIPIQNVTVSDDEEVEYDALEKAAKSQLDSWAENLTYDELKNLKTANAIENSLGGLKHHLDTPEGRAHIAELLTRHNTIARIHTDTFGKDDVLNKAAKATNMLEAVGVATFKTGGALRDNTTLELHVIEGESAGEMVSMRHNEIMDVVKRGMDPLDPDVEIIKTERGIAYRYKDNPSQKIEFSVSRDKGKTKYRVDVSHNFVVAHGSSYGPTKAELMNSNRASLITQFLDQQKKLFELLLN